MKSFLARLGALLCLVLSGFDRLRFRGESRLLNNARGLDSYLYQQHIRDVDFPRHAEELTKTLRRQTEQQARAHGVPLKPLNSPELDKEAIALQLAQAEQRTAGPIAVLSVVESCWTYRLRKQANGWVKPVKQPAKCLHYYHYFLHAQLGLCYVRIQSWFPFPVWVGLNGREWLGRQLHERGVPFQKRNNLLLAVGDAALA